MNEKRSKAVAYKPKVNTAQKPRQPKKNENAPAPVYVEGQVKFPSFFTKTEKEQVGVIVEKMRKRGAFCLTFMPMITAVVSSYHRLDMLQKQADILLKQMKSSGVKDVIADYKALQSTITSEVGNVGKLSRALGLDPLAQAVVLNSTPSSEGKGVAEQAATAEKTLVSEALSAL